MAVSEMITDYKNWIKARWANGDTLTTASDALFDKVNELTKETGTNTPPTMVVPGIETWHGSNGPAEGNTTKDILGDLLGHDIKTEFDFFWNNPLPTGETLEDGLDTELATQYANFANTLDDINNNSRFNSLGDAFITEGLEDLEDKLFPQAQLRFLTTNTVFSSLFSRYVLDEYKALGKDRNTLVAKLLAEQWDKASTRILEFIKVSADDRRSFYSLRAELMLKKTTLLTQLVEMKTRLGASVNDMWYKAEFDETKAKYAADITNKRWRLDNEKYKMEAFAALHGATPTRRESTETGWNAMSNVEKGIGLASAGVSLGQGLMSIYDSYKSWQSPKAG